MANALKMLHLADTLSVSAVLNNDVGGFSSHHAERDAFSSGTFRRGVVLTLASLCACAHKVVHEDH